MPEPTCCMYPCSQTGGSIAEKPRIAVFLNGARNYYQYTICEGIIKQAGELGYSVFFFASDVRYIINENNEGELRLFTSPDLQGFDGIIVAAKTITCQKTLDYLSKALPAVNIPAVSVGPPIGGSYSIDSADDGCMEALVGHFIEEHGFTRINFISGPPDNPDAKHRLDVYKKVLAGHGIGYDENRVFTGDFSRECARDAVARFLQDGSGLPQAILCANDNMALGAYAELTRRGLRVPEDIALSGYDCIRDAERHVPRITTVRQPLWEIGRRAVQIIGDVIAGRDVQKEYLYRSRLVLAGSCGCKDNAPVDERQLLRELELNADEMRMYDNISASMMELLTGAYTMQDIVNQLMNLSRTLELKHLYFCVNPDSLANAAQAASGYPDEITLMLGMAGGAVYTDLRFKTKDVLPALHGDTAALVLSPLYFKKNTFGYIAFDFRHASCSMQHVWVKNLRLALENLRTQEELRQYSVALEGISLQDPLTGVLNRRGLEKYMEPLLAPEAQGMLFVIFVDLDGLKQINDTYGHAAGDEAIQVLADILRHGSRPGDIIARIGGDEFVCAGLVPNDEALRSILFSMQSYGTLFNERSARRYRVNASYGWYLQQGGQKLSIMQMIDEADRHLYEQKRLRSRF